MVGAPYLPPLTQTLYSTYYS
uniref:Uncharacterized protein n=1 Tax=Anguilla anguilla TaxID=7936 RepID=A0A0E9RTK0_ANGAN